MSKLLRAFRYADEKHAGQVRRKTKEPYISHPLKVAFILASYKRSKKQEDLLCAALLHDTLEDCDGVTLD